MTSSMCVGWRVLFVAMMVSASAGCSGSESRSAAAWTNPQVAPPAISAVDHTVTVRWQLTDSFDVLSDGTCAGRGTNRGMKNGARIQLQGNTTGFIDETKATATFQRQTLSKKEALFDDGLYCVLRAVFAPALPDPSGYSVKFSGTPIRWDHLGKPGGTPFGRADNPPGYGGYNLGSQRCPNLLDPPSKDC